MGCRGGELSGTEVDILARNVPICDHLERNWSYYTDWADRAVSFGVDNQGQSIPSADVLKMIESAIRASAASTNLSDAVEGSGMNADEVVYLIARMVYDSPQTCSPAIRQRLDECRGG